MTSGIVFDIKKFSIHDGPGIRTTVFLKGCGLRCWWCHNPESQHPKPELLLRSNVCIECGVCVTACPQHAISEQFTTDRPVCLQCGQCTTVCYADAREIVGSVMTVPQVMDALLRDVPFYDESEGGVTFSGGEPLLQPDFLKALLDACKAHDLHTVLDTCGFAPWEALNSVRHQVDLFHFDLKLMDSQYHRTVTGASNPRILDNLRRLTRQGHRVVIRIPIIPHINDNDDNLHMTAGFVQSLPNIERVDLLPYHEVGSDKYVRLGRPKPMSRTTVPTPDHMQEIKEKMETFGLNVSIGG